MSEFSKLFVAAALSLNAIFGAACASSKIETADDKPANVVAEDAETMRASADEPVKITVSTAFEPKSIDVKKGQPVKLAFYRKDEKNCGDEVVFPQLGITKKLPVGETVVVELTPQESGELGFTCGMNMMRGKILVQ